MLQSHSYADFCLRMPAAWHGIGFADSGRATMP
jgi:hypothetical protein